jgi:SAM-dependent methyltransferase
MLRRAVPFLPAPISDRPIVDLGAGTGADLDELWKLAPWLRTAPALLLDAQDQMLRRVVLRTGPTSRVHRLRVDLARVPLPDRCSDLVLSIGTLCCVSDAAVPAVVAESARLLAPGGILILGVPRWRGTADEQLTQASGLVRRAGGRPGHAVFQKPH